MRLDDIGVCVSEEKMFYLPSYLLGESIRWCDEHEKPVIDFVREIIDRGDTFIDVGAAFGLWSIKLADRFDLVLAIEPDPRSFVLLVKNIAENNIANIIPLRVAVGDSWGFRYISVREPELRCRTYLAPNTNEGDGSWVRVDCMPLDVITYVFPRKIDLIKIDVEGAEIEVLSSGLECIQDHRPVVVVECHLDPDRVAEMVRGMGYSIERLKYGEQVYIIGISRG